MPPKHYKSLTLPESTYQGLVHLRDELQRHGLYGIPQVLLSPPLCPACRGPVEEVRKGVLQVACDRCGYSQQIVEVDAHGKMTDGLANGVVLGAAFAALFHCIHRGLGGDDVIPARIPVRAQRGSPAPPRRTSTSSVASTPRTAKKIAAKAERSGR